MSPLRGERRWSLVIPPIRAPGHERAQIHAQLFHGRATDKPPAVVDLVDAAIAIQHKRIGNGNWSVVGISSVNDVEFSYYFLLVIAEEGEGCTQTIAHFPREHWIVHRNDHQLAIVNN